MARTCPPEVAKEWDDAETPPTQLNAAFAAMDWFGLPFPEEYGGAGATPLELVIVAEELGKASLDVAMCLSGRLIPTLTVFEFGDDDQKRALVPQLVRGERNYAVAISEPDAGSDAAALRTTAALTRRPLRGQRSEDVVHRCRAARHHDPHVRAHRPPTRPSTAGSARCSSIRRHRG